MPRGMKETEGQLSFDFCLDSRNYVVQSNNLISGRQALKLNSAKLIRAAIMQIAPEDTEVKPYTISIKDLSELLGVPASNLYRDIENIKKDIWEHPVEIRIKKNGKTTHFTSMAWITRFDYVADAGVAIYLNPQLQPFLINLREHYTQYTLQEVLAMKSVYAIRIFELMQSKIMSRVLPKNGTDIQISVQEIKECCSIEKKKSYDAFSNLKVKVIDKAVEEINRVTLYRVSYSYAKKGRAVAGIIFHVNMVYH